MDLTEAEDIKKKQQEYTEELFKKDLHDPDNYNGVIIHVEPDILEYKVKWALGTTRNKASGGDGIPVELFQILKYDAVKVLHSTCQQIWKMQQWPRDWKGQFSFQSQRKAMPKNAQTTAQFHSSHMLVMLEILQARLQQYMNHELADVQAGFRKGRGTSDQIANICWIIEKAREFQKNNYFALLTMSKPLTVWITINCGKL